MVMRLFALLASATSLQAHGVHEQAELDFAPRVELAMIPLHFLTLFAAITPVGQIAGTSGSDASLSVSATVVRPVAISNPVITSEGAKIIVRNSSMVQLRADSGTISQLDHDTTIITSERSGLIVITVIY